MVTKPLDGMEDPKICFECKKRGMYYNQKYVCINHRCTNFKLGVQKIGSQ